MPDYQKLYFKLAARVADVIDCLMETQKECEELYLSEKMPALHLLAKENDEEGE